MLCNLHISNTVLTIEDTDFTEDISIVSNVNVPQIVNAIINIYEARKLNVAYNLAILFRIFQTCGMNMLLDQFLNLDTDSGKSVYDLYLNDVKKYLMLM